jgi:hypothetical protein
MSTAVWRTPFRKEHTFPMAGLTLAYGPLLVDRLATRDRSQKPAPQEPKCQKLRTRDWGTPANLRECRRFSPTGIDDYREHRDP